MDLIWNLAMSPRSSLVGSNQSLTSDEALLPGIYVSRFCVTCLLLKDKCELDF
jgi:hypothetical protein